MGFKFRKSIKIAPGVKLNLGKKSAGISVGGKYGGMSFNTKSGTRARVSAPGTGLSYSTKIGGSSGKRSSGSSSTHSVPQTVTVEVNAKAYLWLTILLGWLGIHRFYRKQIGIGLLYMFTGGIFFIGWFVDIIIAIKLVSFNKE